MLSIKAVTSSEVASHYYSQADYYANDGDGDISSNWTGAGAKSLGLSGGVEIGQFKTLLEGHLPDGTTVGRVAQNGASRHKKGWDFTLSAPKSVSILALAGGDRRLIEAHQAAVATALEHLQKHYSVTRQQVSDEVREVLTRNLIVAQFTHTTSRAMDPQLHTHNVIMNLTQRPDGKWRSLESRRMYDVSMKIGQVYRSELAHRARELGYDIEVDGTKGTFEITAVPKAVRRGFSKRRAEIEKAAREYGYRSAKGMDDAAVRTRGTKHHASREELLDSWNRTLAAMEFSAPKAIKEAEERLAASETKAPSSLELKADLEFAYRHLAEREAVFKRDELQTQALRVSMGRSTIHAIERGIDDLARSGVLLDAHLGHGRRELPAYTTPSALRKEKYIISLMQRGKREMPRIAGRSEISAAIEDRTFEPGQAAAVRLLLSSKDRVVGVQGYAGTGKTYMLSTVREIAEKNGYKMRGFSATASAAENLQRETGIPSQTLASHLMSLNNRKQLWQDDKQIWVVDEGSLVKAQDMADLLTLSRRTRSRVYLVGDHQQLGAVEWGKPFYQLLRAGMNYAEMREIIRQRHSPALKSAVEAAIDRKPGAALRQIAATVHEERDRKARIHQIVDRFLKLSPTDRERTLVLIPDNETRSTVNKLIREGLRKEGKVGENQMTLTALTSRGLSREEKGQAMFYRPGDVVIFGRDMASLGVQADKPYTVFNRENDRLSLERGGNTAITWNPSKIAGKAKNGVEVYVEERRELGVGDVIRWRRNDKELGIHNYDVGLVKNIDPENGRVEIAFKRAGTKTVDLSRHGHWEHGYATTVYSGQGATYDNAIVHAESWRRNLINQKSFYVALSRARFRSHVYTDNVEDLARGVAHRLGEKTSAIESKRPDYAKMLESSGLLQNVPKDVDKEHIRGAEKRSTPAQSVELER